MLYGLLALVSLAVLVARDGFGLTARLVGPAPVVEIAAGLGVGLGAVVASLGLERLPFGRRAERALAELLPPLSQRGCLALAALSGLGEELFFRAVLQPWLGIVFASILFGAVHLPPRRELLVWPLLAAIMGFAFGALFAWSGAVLAPVVAHATVNAINLRRLTRRPPVAGEVGTDVEGH